MQYKLCTSDGTATGYISSWWYSPPAGTDYIGNCSGYHTLNSSGRFDKQIDLAWFTVEDTVKEGDEYFWIYLTNPRVKNWGSNTWVSHSGSHHIPSTITIQIVIADDD